MTQQTADRDLTSEPPPPPPSGRPTGRSDGSHARNFSSGFLVKLAFVAIFDAGALYGILAAVAVRSWVIAGFLVLAMIAVNWAYFSKRALPAKYLVPGLIFLFVYVIFAAVYTAFVAFTNYGDGHNSDKADAVAAILAQNEVRVEGSQAYALTVLSRGDQLGFAIVQDGEAQVGSAEFPLEPADDATIEGDVVTAVPTWDVLNFAAIAQQQEAVVALRVQVSGDPNDGALRTNDGSTGYVYESTMVYDEAADTMTNTATGTVYTPDDHGNFRSAEGEVLTPGWRVNVGFENFTRAFQDDRLRGPFLQIFVWTFVFAFLSVATTFVVGLFLAVVFNDPRVKGRRYYRALMILPYAFPAFLAGLVWRGMLNQSFGFVNEVLLGGASVPWLDSPTLAKVSLLMVNLWLGFPYMFLVCTGALQSIPGDVIESARMDGAGSWRVQRSIVMPLLMVSVAPLLVASFAFNFNNFTLIYTLTGGGPNFPGAPITVGATDILISTVYAIAFESGTRQYGFASALSIMIFIIVGAISWWGFRRTRSLEEL
ncbi:ABC transporter permease subunit [Cellulomonas humilata]|uniref:Maltose/maltodextrin transport system permease protein n=1 Tax=Cellulomonas humilata TaxID=144055 RepID=A0ABU0EEM6_9CELL|nr:ABC transporter permease subunit [Cellulomonas humilata]MDQ0373495.1 arabinogalactan oligomer/maltooligosaccharide transport system permease protein [Cellulomonas humilata]